MRTVLKKTVYILPFHHFYVGVEDIHFSSVLAGYK